MFRGFTEPAFFIWLPAIFLGFTVPPIGPLRHICGIYVHDSVAVIVPKTPLYGGRLMPVILVETYRVKTVKRRENPYTPVNIAVIRLYTATL